MYKDRSHDDGHQLYVTRIMLELGIPAHLRGYHYLREAVCLVALDIELVGSVTKLLYPQIAKRFGIEEQKVERGIRNAIEVGWERGNEALFEQLFGYSRAGGGKRPTNSEFIAILADKVCQSDREDSEIAVLDLF